jgi:hypothetical protein
VVTGALTRGSFVYTGSSGAGAHGHAAGRATTAVSRLRAPLILVLLAAFGLLAANASASPRSHAATGIPCAAGSKRAVVAGAVKCLKPGQSCSLKHAADDARAGFTCTGGRLKATSPAAETTRAASTPGASSANPVPLGKPGVLANGWILTVTGVIPDAASTILAADPGNSAPPPGDQYVLVAVSATYNGPGSSHLTPATSLHAVGTVSGVEHSTSDSFCGKLPSPDLDLDNPLVFKGKTITGYAACWMVAAGDVPTLEMFWQPPLSSQQVWFALS